MLRGIVILVAAPFVFLLGLVLCSALASSAWSYSSSSSAFSLYGIFLFLRRQLDLIGSIRQVIASRF